MKVNEYYVDGKFRAERGPFGVEEGELKLDHSANLRMLPSRHLASKAAQLLK